VLISVIIPIGNLARDIQNIENIIHETQKDFIELIFILDTDENLADLQLINLCHEKGLENYQIIKSEGRNPGTSRNQGVLVSKSEWLVFCDSDDLPNVSNIASEIANCGSNIDIVIGTFETQDLSQKNIGQSSFHQNLNLCWYSIALDPGLWRWVVRRSFANNIKFPELSMGEDQCYIAKLLQNNPEVFFSHKIFYRYRIGNRESLVGSKLKIVDLIEILRIELSLENYPKRYNNLKNFMVVRQLITLLKHGNTAYRSQTAELLFKFISTLSPRDYFLALRFILRVLKVR
jgi:glycosyltransferase involved in cell wall biosynthesis